MDPIKYMFEKPVLNGRMLRWTLMLAEFDLKYVPLKEVKGRAVADFLADNPIKEDSVTDMFLSQMKTWFMSKTIAISLNIKKLLVHGDSSLVINQVTGSWKIKSDSLAPHQAKIKELEKYFEEIHYVHLPREENQFANALSKLAALVNIADHIDIMPLCVERRSTPSYINEINGTEEDEIEPWYTSILKFKDTGEYPDNLDARGKRALRMLSTQFVEANGGQLYKKTAQGVLLRCIG
ncbi:uncharacterized protein LOC141619537 [Silene latifolia]|uniref:uncharacterized protein LOC141619537 n=1 Tax=Silene latifolia TaxID=37657 RepID=UPI003D77FFA4